MKSLACTTQLTKEYRFELHHAGIDEVGVVIAVRGNDRHRRHARVAAALEEIQEGSSQVGGGSPRDIGAMYATRQHVLQVAGSMRADCSKASCAVELKERGGTCRASKAAHQVWEHHG